MADFLFAYGTLRKDYHLDLKGKIEHTLLNIGKARISGCLYDLGDYPGAVRARAGREIIGDVFLLTDPDKVLKILDKYEGNAKNENKKGAFVRKRSRVRLDTGKNINAWVYWYNGRPDPQSIIRNKDYLIYIKKKEKSLLTNYNNV